MYKTVELELEPWRSYYGRTKAAAELWQDEVTPQELAKWISQGTLTSGLENWEVTIVSDNQKTDLVLIPAPEHFTGFELIYAHIGDDPIPLVEAKINSDSCYWRLSDERVVWQLTAMYRLQLKLRFLRCRQAFEAEKLPKVTEKGRILL